MTTLSVRRYRSGDGARVRELHEEAMRDVGAFREGIEDADLRRVEETYLDAGGEFLVGELGGDIVAMGAFRPATGYVTEFLDGVDGSWAEIKRMRVDPDHQRRGFGQRIYDDLERRVRERGYETLVLDTTAKQVQARRFYEENGFEEVHRQRVRPDDDPFEMLFYRKPLPTE